MPTYQLLQSSSDNMAPVHRLTPGGPDNGKKSDSQHSTRIFKANYHNLLSYISRFIIVQLILIPR